MLALVNVITVPHFPYLLDYFHLFRSLSNNLHGDPFHTEVELRTWFDKFFESKSVDFYCREIEKLVERCKEVNNNGGYIID